MNAPNWKARPEEFVVQGDLRRVPIVHEHEGQTEIVGEGWATTKERATRRAVAMAMGPRCIEAMRAVLSTARPSVGGQGDGAQFFSEVSKLSLDGLALLVKEFDDAP